MTRRPIPAEAFEHGDPRRYRRGCQCRSCVTGATAEIRLHRYLRSTGRGALTTPARAAGRIALLRSLGMSDLQIIQASNVAPDALYRILRGEGRIRRSTEARILAIPRPTPQPANCGANVPGLGAIRRLRALAADGWTATELANRVGRHKQFIVALQNSPTDTQVRMWVADYIRRLYDDAWHLTPEDYIAPHIAQRTRDRAAIKGWAPTAYWDADDFDNPKFTPALTEPTRYAALAENARELEQQGYTRTLAAERLGVTCDVLQRALSLHREKAAA